MRAAGRSMLQVPLECLLSIATRLVSVQSGCDERSREEPAGRHAVRAGGAEWLEACAAWRRRETHPADRPVRSREEPAGRHAVRAGGAEWLEACAAWRRRETH